MEEDYINMEMDSTFASIFNHPSNNNNNNKEFEFQSFSTYSDHHDRHFTTTASPADELFYMGKLLPLHLPPRLEMVEKILMHTYNNNNTNNAFEQKLEEEGEEKFTTPLASNTPYLSCNISPADSCQVSRELNPQEYFLECSTTTTTTTTNACKDQKKKSWTKKMIKQFKWGNFKSFFNKTSCAVDHHRYNDNTAVPAPSKTTNKNANNAPFGQIKYDEKVSCSCNDKEYSSHRRSFSGAFIRSTLSKTYKKSNSSCYCSNSSSDSSANVSVQVLRRSSSAVSSELESPIQAAIAHCKRSRDQQQQYLIVFKKDC